MTDEEREQEGAEEEIQDLEAPAEEQADVVGGAALTKTCIPPIYPRARPRCALKVQDSGRCRAL